MNLENSLETLLVSIMFTRNKDKSKLSKKFRGYKTCSYFVAHAKLTILLWPSVSGMPMPISF